MSLSRVACVGVDLDACSALCHAIHGGSPSIIQLLLDAGADVSRPQGGKWNYGCPLGYAVEKGNFRLVQRLLDLGADPCGLVGVFGSALRHAVHKGMNAIVTLLLGRGADPNVSTDDFRSPLQSAVQQGDEAMIRQLLDAGADGNLDGGEPFLAACGGGKTHIVQLLIDASAVIHVQRGVPGHALHLAARWGHMGVCKLLVSLGVDVNGQGGKFGYARNIEPSIFLFFSFSFPPVYPFRLLTQALEIPFEPLWATDTSANPIRQRQLLNIFSALAPMSTPHPANTMLARCKRP